MYPQGTAVMLRLSKYTFTSSMNIYCKVRRNSEITKLLLSVRINHFIFLKENGILFPSKCLILKMK